MVKVILNQDDRVLGEKGKIVDVSDGYARNFLIPRKKAVLATDSSIKHYEDIARAQTRKIKKLVEAENAIKSTIEGGAPSIAVKAGVNKKLFGSVTSEMIAKALHAQLDVDVDRRRIIIPAPIRMLGKHSIHVKLKYNILAEGLVEVVADESSKEAMKEAKEKKAAAAEEAAKVDAEPVEESAIVDDSSEAVVAEDAGAESVVDETEAETKTEA